MEEIRQQANEAYRKGQYASAMKGYSELLESPADLSDEDRSTLLSNRAACFLQLSEWTKAEADCAAGMELKVPKMMEKLTYRRGKALEGQGKLAEALRDFVAVLRINPKNKSAIAGAHNAREVVQRQQQQRAGPDGVRDILDEILQAKPNAVHVDSKTNPVGTPASSSPKPPVDAISSESDRSPGRLLLHLSGRALNSEAVAQAILMEHGRLCTLWERRADLMEVWSLMATLSRRRSDAHKRAVFNVVKVEALADALSNSRGKGQGLRAEHPEDAEKDTSTKHPVASAAERNEDTALVRSSALTMCSSILQLASSGGVGSETDGVSSLQKEELASGDPAGASTPSLPATTGVAKHELSTAMRCLLTATCRRVPSTRTAMRGEAQQALAALRRGLVPWSSPGSADDPAPLGSSGQSQVSVWTEFLSQEGDKAMFSLLDHPQSSIRALASLLMIQTLQWLAGQGDTDPAADASKQDSARLRERLEVLALRSVGAGQQDQAVRALALAHLLLLVEREQGLWCCAQPGMMPTAARVLQQTALVAAGSAGRTGFTSTSTAAKGCIGSPSTSSSSGDALDTEELVALSVATDLISLLAADEKGRSILVESALDVMLPPLLRHDHLRVRSGALVALTKLRLSAKSFRLSLPASEGGQGEEEKAGRPSSKGPANEEDREAAERNLEASRQLLECALLTLAAWYKASLAREVENAKKLKEGKSRAEGLGKQSTESRVALELPGRGTDGGRPDRDDEGEETDWTPSSPLCRATEALSYMISHTPAKVSLVQKKHALLGLLKAVDLCPTTTTTTTTATRPSPAGALSLSAYAPRRSFFLGASHILHQLLVANSTLQRERLRHHELSAEQFDQMQQLLLKQESLLQDGDTPEAVAGRVRVVLQDRLGQKALVHLLRLAAEAGQQGTGGKEAAESVAQTKTSAQAEAGSCMSLQAAQDAVQAVLRAAEVSEVRGALVAAGALRPLVAMATHKLALTADGRKFRRDRQPQPASGGGTGHSVPAGLAASVVCLARDAAHASAKLLISTNPTLLTSTLCLDLVGPLLRLASEEEDQLPQFEALLALTNLAAAGGREVKRKIIDRGGIKQFHYLQFSENQLVRRAATEALCNLLPEPELFAHLGRGSGAQSNLRLWTALAMSAEDDLPTALAAAAVVATAAQDGAIADSLLGCAGGRAGTDEAVVEQKEEDAQPRVVEVRDEGSEQEQDQQEESLTQCRAGETEAAIASAPHTGSRSRALVLLRELLGRAEVALRHRALVLLENLLTVRPRETLAALKHDAGWTDGGGLRAELESWQRSKELHAAAGEALGEALRAWDAAEAATKESGRE